MTTDLEEDLRHIGAELHLNRQLDDVVNIGNRRRRRRHRLVAAGAAAAAVVGGLAGTSALLPSSYNPVFPQADAKAWGPRLLDLPADELAAADRTCRESKFTQLPSTAENIAAGSRNGLAILVYRAGADGIRCTLTKTDSGYQLKSGTRTRWTSPDSGFHDAGLGYAGDGTGDGELSNIIGGGMVADDVARLYVEVAGQRLGATIENGVAMFWLPDGITEGELTRAEVVSYDADGELIERERLFGAEEG